MAIRALSRGKLWKTISVSRFRSWLYESGFGVDDVRKKNKIKYIWFHSKPLWCLRTMLIQLICPWRQHNRCNVGKQFYLSWRFSTSTVFAHSESKTYTWAGMIYAELHSAMQCRRRNVKCYFWQTYLRTFRLWIGFRGVCITNKWINQIII